jgi:hypothetical protein
MFMRGGDRGAVAGINAHVVIGKGQIYRFFIDLPLQKPAAQQREFLHKNAVLPRQGQVGSDSILGTRLILLDALEREHSESSVVRELSEDIRHLISEGLLKPSDPT